MNGFLLVDKPKGITSFDVVKIARKALGVRKIGHAGNLDPHATGLLILGIGRATRFIPFIMDLDKEYIATIKLGILTDTLDVTGEVIDRKPVGNFTEEELKNVLRNFLGEIEQVPPSYSAIRVKGQRLYDLAREGVFVTPKPKRVTIYNLEILEKRDDEIDLRVVCSKGTYIRALARDIGEKLGTYGIVKELRRTKIGPFSINEAIKPEDIKSDSVIPIDQGLRHLPSIVINDRAAWHFRNGNSVGLNGIVKRIGNPRTFQHVKVYDPSGKFLGIGLLKWDGVYPKRVLPE